MNEINQTISPANANGLDQAVAVLAKPGVVFSEPVTQGSTTVITASEYRVEEGEARARPVAVIVITPRGVKVRRMNDPARPLALWFLMTFFVSWAVVMLMHPAWRPQTSLLDEVARLIRTIRGEAGESTAQPCDCAPARR